MVGPIRESVVKGIMGVGPPLIFYLVALEMTKDLFN